MTATSRAGLRYPAGSDPNNMAVHMQNLAEDADNQFPISTQGLLSARPATPHTRELYWATNDRGGKLFYGDGSSWKEIGPSVVSGPVTGYTGLITAPTTAAASDTVLGLRGKTGQTGPLQKWIDPVGVTMASIDADGSLSMGVNSVIKARANGRFGTGADLSGTNYVEIGLSGSAIPFVAGKTGGGGPGYLQLQSTGGGSLMLFGDGFRLWEGKNEGGAKMAFYNAVPIFRPTVTGSRASGAAAISLLTAMTSLGLVIDASSA